jgi:enoyl-CoA hydratase
LVNYEVRESIAVVTMDDGSKNILTLEMLRGVAEALSRAREERRCAVFAGRPGIFAAGFDLKVLRGGGAPAGELLDAGFDLAQQILTSPTPIVAAVTGPAIAMGTFLVTACDLRIGARTSSRLAANEVAIGMAMPRGITELCRTRFEPSALRRILTLAEPYEGEAAVEIGLLDLTASDDEVVDVAVARATAMSALHLSAFAVTKERVLGDAPARIAAAFNEDRVEREAFLGQSSNS